VSDNSNASAGISPASKSQVFEMNAAVEARSLIEEIAGPQVVGGKIKAALDRVARKTGLSHRRVRGLWNGEARAILAGEMDALRRVARKREEAAARDELSELRARMSRLETILAASLPDMAREEIDRLRPLVVGEDGGPRAAHRSMD